MLFCLRQSCSLLFIRACLLLSAQHVCVFVCVAVVVSGACSRLSLWLVMRFRALCSDRVYRSSFVLVHCVFVCVLVVVSGACSRLSLVVVVRVRALSSDLVHRSSFFRVH